MNVLRRPFQKNGYYNVTLILIAVNVLVFVAQRFFGRATVYLALNPALVIRYHFFWQFVTYMFAHGGIQHILFNMLALFMFGSAVEKRVGSREFLLYYFFTGITAGIISFFINLIAAPNVFLLGASGALFAVQLAYAALFPDSIIYIWGLIPLRAPVMVILFTGIELFSAATGLSAGVAHLTHLAGFATGWLYFVIRYGYNPWRAITRR
jgi:membrane associated rhomboid family serine protease